MSTTATHHGPITHLAEAVAWLRGSTTARHVQAANTALDRVDHVLDRAPRLISPGEPR